MSTRVIAGSAKGRKLKLVPGDSTRPIMDRVKEALFSILGRDVYDARVLDIFAGTGAVGIEALSRGAEHCTFVDLAPIAIKTIKENLAATGLAEYATIRQADAFSVLKQAPSPVDILYIAPPQYKSLWLDMLHALDAAPGWVAEDGIVVVQIDPKEHQAVALNHFESYDQRRYGSTLLWFFRPTSSEAAAPSEETPP